MFAISSAVFHESGGFDEEFFAYYEDVDLGWRLWVLGHEVHYVPSAVCYHHHSSTSRRLPYETVRLLQTRNPLLACVKNYERHNFERVLPVALGVFLRRMRLTHVPALETNPVQIHASARGVQQLPVP